MADQQETETKLAFLEKAHEDLSDVVLRQRQEIDRLNQMIRALNSKMTELARAAPVESPNTDDERPPHY